MTSSNMFKQIQTDSNRSNHLKLQSAEFEDEEMMEESINVFKHYMLNKIDE